MLFILITVIPFNTQVDISCQKDKYYIMQSPGLNKTTGDFSPPVASIAHPSTKKLIIREEVTWSV